MFSGSRINAKTLASLSRRLATALNAGIDARRVFSQEASRATGLAVRENLRIVSEAIDQGESTAGALAAADGYFPKLFLEMVKVGEETGHLSEAFAQLAAHYENQVRLQRVFLASLVWPMLQLGLAIAVVGLLIWVQGIIGQQQGKPVDILGWGLIGNSGLIIYLLAVAVAGGVLFFFLRALRRGALWTHALQRAAIRLPGFAGPLTTICLARVAWTMHLTFSTGMSVFRCLRLSLQSAGNAHYVDQIEPIERAIKAGASVAEAFGGAEAFPAEFVDTLHVAEESGQIAESMSRLAADYQHRALVAMKVMARLIGFAVWGLVAITIIVMIFSIASFYFSTLRSFM